jgi:hypothetical protein
VALVITSWSLPAARGVLVNVFHVRLESLQTLHMQLNAPNVGLVNIKTL